MIADVAVDLTREPEDLKPFIRRLRDDHPDEAKCGFIMMRFGNTLAHQLIARVIKDTLSRFGLIGLRADDRIYSEDLFPNIRTYMHGCHFGIAVFERLTTQDFNPNVSLEVGYMLAQQKPVCLLKDKTLPNLHTDLVGRLYQSFDPQQIEQTLPRELEWWLRDKEIIFDSDPAHEMRAILAQRHRNAITLARGYARLMELGWTQMRISKELDVHQTNISNHLSLLKLPREIQELVERDKITLYHTYELRKLPREQAIRTAIWAAKENWSVRRTQREIHIMQVAVAGEGRG